MCYVLFCCQSPWLSLFSRQFPMLPLFFGLDTSAIYLSLPYPLACRTTLSILKYVVLADEEIIKSLHYPKVCCLFRLLTIFLLLKYTYFVPSILLTVGG